MKRNPGNILHAPLDTVEIVLLERAVRAEMVTYKDGHNLALGHPARTISVSDAVLPNGRQTHFLVITPILLSNFYLSVKIYRSIVMK